MSCGFSWRSLNYTLVFCFLWAPLFLPIFEIKPLLIKFPTVLHKLASPEILFSVLQSRVWPLLSFLELQGKLTACWGWQWGTVHPFCPPRRWQRQEVQLSIQLIFIHSPTCPPHSASCSQGWSRTSDCLVSIPPSAGILSVHQWRLVCAVPGLNPGPLAC